MRSRGSQYRRCRPEPSNPLRLHPGLEVEGGERELVLILRVGVGDLRLGLLKLCLAQFDDGREAQLRAQAVAQQTRQLKDVIVRDVQTAWLDANNAFTRLGVTAQLLNQANESLGLAQTRYKLGLSSIVELSQAQLQQTEANITNTNAQYQYRLTLAALNFQTGVQP